MATTKAPAAFAAGALIFLKSGGTSAIPKSGFLFVGKENKPAMREYAAAVMRVFEHYGWRPHRALIVFDRALAVRQARSASLTDKDSSAHGRRSLTSLRTMSVGLASSPNGHASRPSGRTPTGKKTIGGPPLR